MGADKALLKLDGRPLIQHAVEKLQEICSDVRILGNNASYGPFAPLVADLHQDCGPLGGIEAALLHSRWEWNLIVPVDLPLVPVAFLRDWVEKVIASQMIRVSYCDVEGKEHPALVLIRRDTAPEVTAALERGDYKLLPALCAAAGDAGALHVESLTGPEAARWFVNLNTPSDLERIRTEQMLRESRGAGAS